MPRKGFAPPRRAGGGGGGGGGIGASEPAALPDPKATRRVSRSASRSRPNRSQPGTGGKAPDLRTPVKRGSATQKPSRVQVPEAPESKPKKAKHESPVQTPAKPSPYGPADHSAAARPGTQAHTIKTNGVLTGRCDMLLDEAIAFEQAIFFLHAYAVRTPHPQIIRLLDSLTPGAPFVTTVCYTEDILPAIDVAEADGTMLRMVARPVRGASPTEPGFYLDFARPIEDKDLNSFDRDTRKSKAMIKQKVAACRTT